MGLIKNYAFKLAPSTNFSSLIMNRRISNAFFAYYHIVSDEPVPHTDHIIPRITTQRFIADLDALFSKFAPLDLSDVLSKKTIEKPSLLITFDDGYREMAEIVAPILKAKGIPAVFFINSAFADNKDILYRHKASILCAQLSDPKKQVRTLDNYKSLTGTNPGNAEETRSMLLSLSRYDDPVLDQWAAAAELDFGTYLETVRPFLTTEQMQQMVKDGFYFGGHSVSHYNYATLDLEEQLSQTLDSIDFVQKKLNLSYRTFAFPFSDKPAGKIFFDRIFAQDNPRKPDFLFGNSGIKHDYHPKMLQRFSLERLQQSPIRTVQGEILYSALTGKTHNR